MARGAPSQHSQPSRKGKKAWRKNIDIDDVEQALENIREEERVTGSALHKKADHELFEIDLKGDEKVRHTLPKYKPNPRTLTSLKVLSERSAIPAVFSRPSSNKKSKLSREDKSRLLRIAKRPIKGPFGVILDPASTASTGDVSEAVKSAGCYDPWATTNSSIHVTEVDAVADTLPTNPNPSHLPPSKPPPSASTTAHPRTAISLPAVPTPHAGTSYNPLYASHQALLVSAIEQEKARLQEAEKGRDVKERMLASTLDSNLEGGEGALGMQVDIPSAADEGEEERDDAGILPPKKPPPRKTRQQKLKAARLLAEKRALAARAHKRRQLGVLSSLSSRSVHSSTNDNSHGASKRAALEARIRTRGLVGQRLGKHRVPEGLVDVQVGEELSESLRGLKPEGNLFKDRFLNLQQRALVEPRIRVLPKRRKHRMIEYEKHAWKRFDREQNGITA